MPSLELKSQSGFDIAYFFKFEDNEFEDSLKNELSLLNDQIQINGFRKGTSIQLRILSTRDEYIKKAFDYIKKNYESEFLNKVFSENVLPHYKSLKITEYNEYKSSNKFIIEGEFKEDILIPIINIKDLNVYYLKCDIEEVDILEYKKYIMDNKKITEEDSSNDPIENEDFVSFEYSVKLKGDYQVFDSGSLDIIIGENNIIKPLEDRMISMKMTDITHDLDIKIPNDYHHKDTKGNDIAGKDALFYVKIKDVKKRTFISNENQMIQYFKCDNKDSLNDKIKNHLKNEKIYMINFCNRSNLLSSLSKFISRVDKAKDYFKDDIEKESKSLRIIIDKDKSLNSISDEKLNEIAMQRVYGGCGIRKYAIQNNIQILEADVISFIKRKTSSAKTQEEAQGIQNYYLNNPNIINNECTEEKSISIILSQISNDAHNITYHELKDIFEKKNNIFIENNYK